MIELKPVATGIHYAFRDNPFPVANDYREGYAQVGRSLDEIVTSSTKDWQRKYLRVMLNGEIIEQDQWALTFPAVGDNVAIVLVPQGGDIGKTLGMIAIVIVAAVAAYFTGGAAAAAWGPAWGAAVGAAVGATVTLIGTLAINALFPPPAMSFDSSTGAASESATYGFNKQSNTATPYGAIPRVYGRLKLFPVLAAVPYIVSKGDTQYLYQIFTAGYGPLKIEDLRIGDNPLSTYQGVEYYIHQSLTSGDQLQIVKFDTWQDPYSIYLKKGVIATAETTDDADSAWIDIQFAQGLCWISSTSGSRNTQSVEFSIKCREVGSGTWQNMTDFNASVEGNANVKVDVVRKEWTQISDVYTAENPNFPTVSELPDSSSRANNEKVTKTWYEGGDEWNSGTTYFQDYENHYELAGTSNIIHVEATTQKPFYTTVKLNFPKRGKYEVQVIRQTDDREDQTTNPSYDKAYFACLTSVKNVAPIRPDKPISVVELKIKATEQLNGQISNFNFIATSMLPVYDGNSWSLRETRNPAWAYLDVMRGEGAKRKMPDERLDLPAFLDWARWCDQPALNAPNEPRACCDLQFASQTTAWEALKTIASTGYAAPADNAGKFSITIDRLRDSPVQLFTPRNIIAFSGEMNYHIQPHALRMQFTPTNETVQDEVVVFDDGYSADGAGGTKVATIYETVKLVGITRPTQAYVLGRRAIAQGRLRIETFSLTCDAENLLAGRGSWVRVAHDVPKLAAGWGKVIQANGRQIVIDEDFALTTGTIYAKIRRADGSQADATLTNVYENRATISASVAEGDLIVYGELQQVTLDCLVKSVKPAEDLKAALELTPYAPEIYRAEVDPIPPYNKNGTHWTGGGKGGATGGNTTTPGMVTNLLGSYVLNKTATKPSVDITLSWSVPKTGGQTKLYKVFVFQAGNWAFMGDTGEVSCQPYLGFQFMDENGNPVDPQGKSFTFAVTGVGIDGSFIPPEVAAHVTIVIGEATPSGVSTLYATGGVFENVISWNLITNGFDVSSIEIWGGKFNDRSKSSLIASVPMPNKEYHHVGLQPGINWYYWARCTNSNGLYSDWFPANPLAGVMCRPSDDATYLLDQLFGKINTDQIAAELNKRIDLIDGDPKTPGTIPYRLAMLQGEITDLTMVADYDPAKQYAVNDLAKYNGILYRCQVACKGIVPTNTTYWEKIGEYSSLADAVAGHTQQIKTVTDQTGALSTKVDNVVAKTDQNTAAISNEAYARANADSALSNQISVVTAQTNQNKADILSEANARSTADSALATTTTQLQARLDTGDYAAVKQTASATASKVDGINAKWGVQVDAGGRVAGVQLNSSSTGSSSFTVLANNFNVYHPSASGPPTQVFGIGQINGQSAVGVRGNMIVDGSIVGRSIAVGEVGTITIAGNAVTVPATVSSTNFVDIQPYAIDVQICVITLNTPGVVFAAMNTSMEYPAGTVNNIHELKINGVVVGRSHSGSSYTQTVSLSGALYCDAGQVLVQHTVWKDNESGWLYRQCFVTNRTLYVQGAKR